MTKRLTLQSRDADTGNYADVDTVPGALYFVGGSAEALRSGAPMAVAQWKAFIRYRTDVRAEWRVIETELGQVFQISGYGDADGKKAQLQLVLTEVQ